MRSFQSTRPVWGATRPYAAHVHFLCKFQSTRPVWGATPMQELLDIYRLVSIHAPRVGRDPASVAAFSISPLFQSTRPVWGATPFAFAAGVFGWFQSTRPVWGATKALFIYHVTRKFQSTRPVWGATSCCHIQASRHYCFNPRAPCGARRFNIGEITGEPLFQSTRPVWGATASHGRFCLQILFQSTRPVWGATYPSSIQAIFL